MAKFWHFKTLLVWFSAFLVTYTLCLKKVRTFKLSVTLSNVNRFVKFCTVGKRMKFATNPYDTTHLTLGILLHYLGKLKMQISADIQHIWKKMQTNCIFIASTFYSSTNFHIFSV